MIVCPFLSKYPYPTIWIDLLIFVDIIIIILLSIHTGLTNLIVRNFLLVFVILASIGIVAIWTFTLSFTEAELETIGAALDDYMAYADDEFANQDDLIGGLPVEDRINSINDKITTVLGFHI